MTSKIGLRNGAYTPMKHITFILCWETCPLVKINNCELFQTNNRKYLGIHLDRRLTWQIYIFIKRKHLGITESNVLIYRMQIATVIENTLMLHQTIHKPMWLYDIQFWGTGTNSNIEILQRFQNKVIRAPRYVLNYDIQQDIRISSVNDILAE